MKPFEKLHYAQLAQQARQRIAPYLMPTPLLFSARLSEITGKQIWLKLETQNPTGSFKVRPAFNGILAHLDAARSQGVLTTSSGNYAQAVAYASKKLGVQATIVMTDDTAPIKVRRTKELGAEVVFCGMTFESRFEVLEALRKERGSLVLHGFDSPETIAGDGVISLELLEQVPSQEFAVVSPASGGGLISGIASVFNEARPSCKVYGFQPEIGGAIFKSLQAGERVNVGKVHTIADALVASMPGERTFGLIQKSVSGFGLVSEEEIRRATRFLIEEQKIVTEPGGAVSVAGLLSGKVSIPSETVVCVISGGNAELSAPFFGAS